MADEGANVDRKVTYYRDSLNYSATTKQKTWSHNEYSGNLRVEQWSRSSSRTPGFHNPARRGVLKPLPFSYSTIRKMNATGTTEYRVKNESNPTFPQSQLLVEIAQGTWAGEPLLPNSNASLQAVDQSLVSKTADQANQKLLSKIKNMSANLAVASAEMHKTANMVTKAATSIAGAIRNLRKGNFHGAAASLGVPPGKRAASRFSKAYAKDAGQAVASGWLALSYGWKPLLSDVYGVAEDMAKKNTEASMLITQKSRVSRRVPIQAQSNSYPEKGVTIQTVLKGEGRYDVQVSVTYRRPMPNIAIHAKETGLLNPLEVAWELVPYSFVVDWFLPIGNWLSNLDATAGLEFVTGYRTTFTRISTGSTEFTYGESSTARYSGLRRANFERVNCNRVVLSSFPSVGVPRFKNPLSFSHAASAVALLTNLFRK